MCGSTSSKAWLQAVASSSCDNKSVDARPRKKTIGEQDAKKKTTFVCKVDGGLLTIIMNSLVLLIKGGCMKFADGELSLTSSGYLMCEQMADGRGDMLNEILKDLPALLEQMEKMEDVIEDKRYVIAI